MKKILVLFIALLFQIPAMAQLFFIDELIYEETGNGEVCVSHCFSDASSIEIPDIVENNGRKYSVTSIGDYAFSSCRDLTSVSIPNSVTSIGDHAFYYCNGLTSVSIGNSVVSIGDNAFYYCYSLTYVIIPNSVTSIGDEAFYYSGLTSVIIPNSVTSIGNGAFSSCSRLASIGVDAANKVYCSIDGVVLNKAKTEIVAYPAGRSGEYIIPNSVISIEDHAFHGCSGLTSVSIPNSVTSIGDLAFGWCDGLTSVSIPNSVTSIGDGAFASCSGVASIDVDAANKAYCSINGVLFNKAKTEIVAYPAGRSGKYIIPNSVISIEDHAFQGCRGLTSVSIPNSVTSIGESAFQNCRGLTSVSIPNSVTNIGEWAFFDSGLTSVSIPNSVTNIEAHAFAQCSNLTSVVIPNSVISIGDHAFQWCSGLTFVSIPNSVTSIGDYAFYGCSDLTSVVIPNSVTSIGDWAFADCWGLTSVSIPNSVTRIGHYAFQWCWSLESIYMASARPPFTGEDVLDDVPSSCIIYVPKGSREAYAAKAPWNEFTIEEYDTETGIESAKTVPMAVEVYSINGRKLGRFDSMEKARKQLPADLYIVNGKKMLF